MRLYNNLMSMNVLRGYSKSLVGQSNSMSKLSSGYKVNKAGDGPNVIGQSEQMRMQIRGHQMAQKNVQDGVSMLQTFDGGLESITTAIHRIKELTVQAGGVNTEQDRQVIQNEINQMLEQVGYVAKNTEFNGVKLLDKQATDLDNLSMAAGANKGEAIDIPMFNLNPSSLKVELKDPNDPSLTIEKSLADIDVVNKDNVGQSIEILDKSLSEILSVRSRYGAIQNRFESTLTISSAISSNIEASESTLRDVDIAEEMMNLAKFNVLTEAGNAMMVQTNKFPQDILRILERVR